MSTIINATTTNGVVIQPDNSGSLQLATNSGTTAVTIDTSQNVGIGTTSPSVRLHLKGASFANAIRWEETGGSNNFYAGPIDSSGNFGLDNNSTSGYTRFVTNSTERMRIDSSGNVLVGTTTSIDVASGSTDGATIYPDSLQISRNGGTPLLMRRRSSNGEMVAFRRDTTFVGSISVTTTATAYNTSSDYRLKENIQPLQNALDVVAQLNPVNYTWKSDGSDGQGFIAHELQAVVPDCVTGEKDGVDAEGNPVYQGVDTSFLVATLTAAIQEQQTIINDLKARIETLEAK